MDLLMRGRQKGSSKMQGFALWFRFGSAMGLAACLWLVSMPVHAQNGGIASTQGRQSPSVGAPQVLEIPIPQTTAALSAPSETAPVSQTSDFGEFNTNAGWPANAATTPDDQFPEWYGQSQDGLDELETAALKRTYLGVLYATSEEGPEGVSVLSVIDNSPAARAGFEGANTPPSQNSGLMKAAIVVLAMSPAGPFAIPLAIAHDMYTNRHPLGDLIVAVKDQPVRNAQEFTETMQRFQPGDRVPFKVLRQNKLLQITVALEEEPL